MFSFLFSEKTNAQIAGLEFMESDSLHTDLAYDNYNLSFIYLKNNRSDSIFLSWEITSKELPDEWYVTICDNVACYGVVPDGADMYGIAPSDSVYIRFEVNPYDIDGFGKVEVNLKETDNASDISSSIVYTFLTKNFTNIVQAEVEDVSYVYPNPFKTSFFLKNPFADKAKCKIINDSGSPIKLFELNASEEKEIFLPTSSSRRLFLLVESGLDFKVIPLINIQ